MLKVAQIMYSGLGGHGSVAFSLIDADREGDWRPIMGFFGVEPLNPSYLRKCESLDIPYASFLTSRGRSWAAWHEIFRWLWASRPEAVILHSTTALLPCVVYACLVGARLVVVEHQPNALKSRSEWVFSRLSMALGDCVVVLTPAYDRELKEKLGAWHRAGKVRLIPNGVDTSRYAPAAHAKRDARSTVRLGMAARFTRMKRQDALVDALAELRRREPGVNWLLSLAGDGESRPEIVERARAKGLDAFVDFPGLLDEDRLIDWYRSIDVYLHASEGETLSTALLQAMASDLPIVASDVPGISNLISGETVCGVLVPGQDPTGFASAVVELVKDPALRSDLARAARRMAVTSYSHDQMFAKFGALLSKGQGARVHGAAVR